MPDQANGGSWIRYVPNSLSIMRLLLALGFPAMPSSWWIPVIITGGLSDVLDGFIARRFHVTSRGGGTLDGVADKMFVLSVLATVTVTGHLALWAMLLVLLRDIVVAMVSLDLVRRGRLRDIALMQPSRWGKIATLGQYGVMLAALNWEPALLTAIALAGAFSVFAGADYGWQYILRAREDKAQAEAVKP